MNNILILVILILSFYSTAYSIQEASFEKEISAMTIPDIMRRFPLQNGSADYAIGLKFLKGLGLEKNIDTAFKQFLKASKKGNKAAMVALGKLLFDSEIDTQEFFQDISWLKDFADKNDLAARYLLDSVVACKGMPDVLKKDIKNFLADKEPLEDLALKGNPTDPLAKNIVQAAKQHRELLKNAADNGNIKVAYFLGKEYRRNSAHQDLAQAFHYIEMAAQKEYAPALNILSEMYRNGEGVARNPLKAFQAMHDAAQKGYAPAQFTFGIMLINGFVHEKNFSQGVEWIEKAATQDLGGALAFLGELAREGFDRVGNSIEPDYQAAFELFKRSAAQKSFNGMYNLAQFYQSGLGGNKDTDQAIVLFDKILRDPSHYSRSVKALMYETGIGVTKDLVQAKELYTKEADDEANLFAHAGLERVNEKLQKQAEKALEAQVKKTPSSKSKKAREKRKAKANASTSKAAPESESEEELEPIKDIDIAGHALKNNLNAALTYNDKSFIQDIDTQNNKIVIQNPYDHSLVTIDAYHKGPITQKELKSLKKFIYDDRVKAWFDPQDQLLKTYTQEQIERHRFAERVDELVQLYGAKAVFIKQDGTLEKNRILIGDIKTHDNRILKGTFEYAYYKDKKKGNVIYHRFLHPHSKIRI